jgi:glycosyltransferase involved in cell wall biosynthesis
VSRRLLLAIDTLVPDGAERQFALTATNLPSEWEVRCFSAGGGPYADHLKERGLWLRVAERRWRSDPLPFLRLWALAARWRPDVVHSWGYMTTLAGFPAFRALRIPYIDATVRTGDLDLFRGSRLTWGMDKATLVAANTRCGLDAAGVAPDRARVVPNGFDLSRLSASPPERRDPRFTVIMTGRMEFGIKDYSTVFAAARRLAASVTGSPQAAAPSGAGAGSPPIRFVVLGKGPDKPALQAEAQDLVDAGILEFGYSTDVIADLLLADCGVLMTTPPKVEGCSNSILEYMACGLPVVAGRGGGNDELVGHEQTGFLVPPSDPDALAERLRWVYDNREAAREMGARGAAVVRDRHSVEAMVRATVDLYEEAIALGPRR